MRNILRVVLVGSALLLPGVAACGKKDPAPPPATAAPAPEPTAAPEADTAAPAAPEADTAEAAKPPEPDTAEAAPAPEAEADASATPTAAEADAGAAPVAATADHDVAGAFDAFFASKEVPLVLYFPGKKAIVSEESFSVEGAGSGAAIAIYLPDGKGDRLDLYAANDDEETIKEKAAARRKTLVARFAGEEVVRIPGTPWPEADSDGEPKPGETMKIAGDRTLTFRDNTLSATKADGTKLAEIQMGPTPDEPHIPAPQFAFAAEGVDVVVVSVFFDPGDKYGEYNLFTTNYVVVAP